jgi:hypothetical protein
MASSEDFSDRARASGLVPSMGSVGRLLRQPDDRVVRVPHASRAAGPAALAHPHELANAIFGYLEIWYSRRRHSSLGMLTPIESKTAHQHPWHENPETRLHRTRGTPQPPDSPGRFTQAATRTVWKAQSPWTLSVIPWIVSQVVKEYRRCAKDERVRIVSHAKTPWVPAEFPVVSVD